MAPDDKSRWLVTLPPDDRQAFLSALNQNERAELQHLWELWGRSEQRAPTGDWRLWLILAGRGFGKTRAGAEWVDAVVRGKPPYARRGERCGRIALVATSEERARPVAAAGAAPRGCRSVRVRRPTSA